MHVRFQQLTANDYPLLLEWLQRPHVKRWWDDGDDTLEKVAESYNDSDGLERWLIIRDQADLAQPVGYIQAYWNDPTEAGIDLFLGESDLLGQGIGSQAVQQMRDLLISRGAQRILIDPHPDNVRGIRCYRRAGFHDCGQTVDDEGNPLYLMEYVSCEGT